MANSKQAMNTTKKYNRVRFHSYADCRPVIFPPQGPWWCSGSGEDYSIVVAYVPCVDNWISELTKYWPEATYIDILQENVDIEYSDRFPKPDWWDGEEKSDLDLKEEYLKVLLKEEVELHNKILKVRSEIDIERMDAWMHDPKNNKLFEAGLAELDKECEHLLETSEDPEKID